MSSRSPRRPVKTLSAMKALTDPDPAFLDARIVVEQLRTDTERGLTTEEAARRLAEVGANDIETEVNFALPELCASAPLCWNDLWPRCSA